MRSIQVNETMQVQPLFRFISDDVVKVRSKSHPNLCHTMRCENGVWGCNCPARVKCWHLKEFDLYLARVTETIPAAKAWEANHQSISDDFLAEIEAYDQEIFAQIASLKELKAMKRAA